MAERFKPKIDRLCIMIYLPVLILTLGIQTLSFFATEVLFVSIPVSLFVGYFLVSPLFGYVELREDGLYIKYGIFLKKTISYESIRGVKIESRFYSDSMMSLKLSYEHINIKYNKFDVTTVSVRDNYRLVELIGERAAKKQ